ncbi:hypothetical protein HMI54_000716 [Coelomomyces lativittatus]|nr:hypothetical protein HMI54_000716 [Coelomomyces lativittatus]
MFYEFEISLELTPERFKEIPGAKDILQHLLNQGRKIAFATGAWKESAMLKLHSIDIDPSNYPFGNGDHSIERSEIIKEAIAQAEQFYSSNFKRTIYIGDGKWDFETCRELGIKFIGIDSKSNGQLKKLGASIVFKNFLQKESFIQSLEQDLSQ